MAILMHAVVPGITADQYDALHAKLLQTPGMFEGCLSHVCVATAEGLDIYDVWESELHMNVFAEKMLPVAEALGWQTTGGRPEVFPVYNYGFPAVDR
ncbi:hypothetical protein AB0C90_02375 [Streptomyces sp. NPDC048550]|uniref:hypothetical protein n=1 Tax=unclassified Streptomyces TaxID=2593676 RepID=UPI0022588BA2|nr:MULTISPECIES: hypothetical protein [unclassified Streptomyces]MCX5151900.1 hypothetical protein [Streptomyces sp. NBC_00320]WSN47132.1 hypothetical protein OG299_05185 [Streptomyces sp. NBC_01296]